MNHKLIKLYLIFPLLSILLNSCSTDNCLHSSGSVITTRIETGYFKKIDVEGIFDVLLTQDSINFIEFTGGSNLLEYTQAQNHDSILTIDNTNSCYFLHDYQKIIAQIHFKNLKEIYLNEPCSVKSSNAITDDIMLAVGASIADAEIELNCYNFYLYTNRLTGGTYVFKGHSNICSFDGYYISSIDASNLEVNTMHVRNYSIADFIVNVKDKLYVEIHNKGNVVYYGTPKIELDSICGSGQIIKADVK
jgi:hypothetical protein